MNKHLLQTRLNSLAHYQEEANRLKASLDITNSTRKELIVSLVEFCPFKKGHLIMKGDTIRKVAGSSTCNEQFNSPGHFYFTVPVHRPNDHTWGSSVNTEVIMLEDVSNWRILNEKEVAQQEQEVSV